MAAFTRRASDSSDEGPSYEQLLFHYLRRKNLREEDADTIKFLLNEVDDVNVFIDCKRGLSTLLHVAVEKGHLDVVKDLIARGSDVNLEDEKGLSPLRLAESINEKNPCAEKHKAVWEYLVGNFLNETLDVSKAFSRPASGDFNSRRRKVSNCDFGISNGWDSQVRTSRSDPEDPIQKVLDLVKSSGGVKVLKVDAKEHGDGFLKETRFFSGLKKSDDLFFIDLDLTETDVSVVDEKVLKNLEGLTKLLLIQCKSSRGTKVYAKEDGRSPYVVRLNDSYSVQDAEVFRERFLEKHTFGLSLIVEGLKSGILGNFRDENRIRSLLEVEFEKGPYERIAVLDQAVRHDDTFVTKYLTLDWDWEIRNKLGKTILYTAIKNAGVATLAALLSVSFPLPQHPRENVYQLLNQKCDFYGNTPLMLSAKLGKFEMVRFLIGCGAKVNETNKDKVSAASYAWSNGDFTTLLELLKADSVFPAHWNYVRLRERQNAGTEKLKSFVEERIRLHESVERGDLQMVKELVGKQRCRLYMNERNESAAYVAIKFKQWSTYAYLISQGVSFPEKPKTFQELKDIELKSIQDEMEQYFFQAEGSHVMKMTSVSWRLGSPGGCTLENFYKSLDEIECVSCLLKVLQNVSNLNVIFDFDANGIERLDELGTSDVYGATFYEISRIYVGAMPSERGGRPMNQVLGTLAHELAHQAMHFMYNNECKPYAEGDVERKDAFETATKNALRSTVMSFAFEEMSAMHLHKKEIDTHIIDSLLHRLRSTFQKESGEDEGQLEGVMREIDAEFVQRFLSTESSNIQVDDILKKVFLRYPRNRWHAELIVVIPHLLVVHGEEKGLKLIHDQIPDLLKYYRDTVIKDIGQNINSMYFIKNHATVEIFNECSGELRKIQNSTITLETIKDYKPYVTIRKNVRILCTSSPLLCSINVYLALLKLHKHISKSGLFCRLSYFHQNESTVISALKLTTCKFLILIFDCDTLKSDQSVDLDEETRLFEDPYFDEKEVIMIMHRKCYGSKDLKQISFYWNELTQLAKEHIIQKRVKFRGKLIQLENLVDPKLAGEIFDPESLAILVEHGAVEIGSGLIGYDKDCYVEREFGIRTVNPSILRVNEKQWILFLSNVEMKDILPFRANENDVKLWENEEIPVGCKSSIIFLTKQRGDRRTIEMEFRQVCNKLPLGYSAHWLDRKDSLFTWERTKGDISQLLGYSAEQGTHPCKHEEMVERNDEVVLLAEDPGMGKSTALSKIILEMREKHAFRFDLNDYADQSHRASLGKIDFGTSEHEKAIEFTLAMMNAISPLECAVYRHLCKNSCKIAFLFDGFDEICPEYREKVVKLLKVLRECTKAQIWVTTRLGERQYLEKEMMVFAHTLKPLSPENQVIVMDNLWKKKLIALIEECERECCWEKLDETLKVIDQNLKKMTMEDSDRMLMNKCNVSILELQESISKLIEDRSCPDVVISEFKSRVFGIKFESYSRMLIEKFKNFTTVPLHARMLADCVFEDGFRSIKSLDYSSLYDVFMQNKFDIIINKSKHIPGNQHSELMAKKFKTSLLDFHKEIAAKGLYDSKKEISGSFTWLDVLSMGFMTLRNDRIQFIHRTYAEYFFSIWLCENLQCKELQKFLLGRVLIDSSFEMVRKFLETRIRNGKAVIKNIESAFHDVFSENPIFKQLLIPILAREGLTEILKAIFDNVPDKINKIFKSDVVNDQFAFILCSCHRDVINCVLEFASNHMTDCEIKRIFLRATWFVFLVQRDYFDIFENFLAIVKKNLKGRDWKKIFSFVFGSEQQNIFHVVALLGSPNFFNGFYIIAKSELENGSLLKFYSRSDNSGQTILHKLSRKGNLKDVEAVWNIMKSILNKECFQSLVEKCDNNGKSVLHYAASNPNKLFYFGIMRLCSDALEKEKFRQLLLKTDHFGITAKNIQEMHKTILSSQSFSFVLEPGKPNVFSISFNFVPT